MPGDIKFVIAGDASVYEKELNRIKAMTDETKRRVDALYKTLKLEDTATDIMVKETVDKTQIQLSNIRTNVEKEEAELDKLELKRQQTETRVRFTVSGALIGLRAVTDIAALATAISGEQIDVQFLSMISMGLSAALQMKTMAAVYAVTPGGMPIAMMMLSMIPVLTGVITYIKSEQLKAQTAAKEANIQQIDLLLDGVNF